MTEEGREGGDGDDEDDECWNLEQNILYHTYHGALHRDSSSDKASHFLSFASGMRIIRPGYVLFEGK